MLLKAKSISEFNSALAMVSLHCKTDHRLGYKHKTIGGQLWIDIEDKVISDYKISNPMAAAEFLEGR